ncbi:hypothetical protein M422DRAFT_241463 [Sphaerobolus stellatus SS14]|nr:hypothetical protein M422DRAFT_241463 [Sphaerobolus stellatus SS14]
MYYVITKITKIFPSPRRFGQPSSVSPFPPHRPTAATPVTPVATRRCLPAPPRPAPPRNTPTVLVRVAHSLIGREARMSRSVTSDRLSRCHIGGPSPSTRPLRMPCHALRTHC